MRMKRMGVFESFFEAVFGAKMNSGHAVSVIDIGGTYEFWKSMHFKYINNVSITLVNIVEISKPSGEFDNIISVKGDATNLTGFAEKEFDLVFSNSCIEHVGGRSEWEKMASEIFRISDHFFVQTPNRYFPIEPHFLFPLFQFFPLKLRALLIRCFQLGFWPQGKSWEESIQIAKEIELLSYKDLERLFPGAIIKSENFMGLTKSFMVYK